MKKFISILLLVASILSFYIMYNNENALYRENIENIENNLPNSYKIMIPVSVDSQEREKSYNEILKILDKYNGSIYYDRLSSDKTIRIKYIYDKDNLYISNIKIKNGIALSSDMMKTNKFMSTRKNNNENQVGRIASFNKNIDNDIKTLKSMLDDGFNFSGSCYVAFKKPIDIKNFTSDLEKNLNIKGVTTLDKLNFNITQENNYYKLIVLIIYFIVTLLILYDLLNSYKKIGIKKLIGYSTKDIYLESVLSFTIINLIVGLISTLGMSLLLFNQINTYIYKFLFKIAICILLETIVLIALCSIVYAYIHFIKINGMLKNKKPLTAIIVLNYLAKLVCLTVLIFFIVQAVNNVDKIKGVFNKSYKNWEVLDDFAVLPTSNITDINYLTDEYLKIQKNIYNDFNASGAILANFSEYSPGMRSVRLAEKKYYYETDNVIVNPNYLNQYSVYDEENNKISISESAKDFIILVPEKYKNDEKAILKNADFWKENSYYSVGKEQSTKIIWTKTNQKIFTATVDINPDDNNEITDPIIHVITESNASLSDYNCILAIEGNPFKIKADSYENVESFICEEFSKYNIEKYIDTITPVNEQVASAAKNVKDTLKTSILFSIMLLTIVIVIILQNSMNYFDKYKQKLAIEKLCGYRIVDKHINYLISIIISWNIVFCLSIVIYKISLGKVAIISLLGLCIEVIFSLIVLMIIEKQKIIKAIKGE